MSETIVHSSPEKENAYPGSILEAAEELARSASPEEAEEAIDRAIEAWRDNPAEHILNSVEELAEVYRDRTDNEVYYKSDGVIEFTSFATRDHTESEIEEVYDIYDEFDNNNKDWKQRTVSVTMYKPDADHHTDIVVRNGEVSVVNVYEGNRRVPLDGEQKDDAVFEFFNRSLVATAKNELRTDEERAAAHADAKRKFEYRLYGGPKPKTTSLE